MRSHSIGVHFKFLTDLHQPLFGGGRRNPQLLSKSTYDNPKLMCQIVVDNCESFKSWGGGGIVTRHSI